MYSDIYEENRADGRQDRRYCGSRGRSGKEVAMYNFQAPLFWFKFVFLAEILVAEILIVYRMKKKKRFAARAAVAVLFCLAVTFALPVPFYNAIYSSVLFLVIFASTLLAMKFCLDEPWIHVMYFGFFSYTQQHIAYQLYNLFCLATDLSTDSDLYGESAVGGINGFQVLVFLVPHIVVYLAGWAIFSYRSSRRGGGFLLRHVRLLIPSVAIVAVNVMLNAFVVYNLPPDDSVFSRVIIVFYNIFSCILALCMQAALIGREEIAAELKFMEEVRDKNRQIYELTKENVDFINMKCHDLRHRIRNARSRELIDENELKEIEEAVNFYDGVLHTGNEVLDVILSEESIFCNRNDVRLICNVDGAHLNFMQPADLYAVFQNGIHNAVDAVMKLKEPHRRVVRLNVRRVENMISVRMENETDGAEQLSFENGLPKTSHEDKNMHGFGMRSIKSSVEKYGGCVCVEVRDGCFELDIMIPVPADEPNAAEITEAAEI